MLKPLTLMARVLTILSVTIVQAQTSLNNSMLCYISADNTSHKVDASITQAHPYTINCNYTDASAAIPKFIQFSCEGNTTLLTVDVQITNGVNKQTITKDIQVNESRKSYEIPVLAYVKDELVQNGNARINSIVFSNNMNAEVSLAELNFSNTTSNYEVKQNQIFTVDLRGALMKTYLIKSPVAKDVNINLYKSNGEFFNKVTKSLVAGDNVIQFEDMSLQTAKYVVVITDDIKKTPNSKITVMY